MTLYMSMILSWALHIKFLIVFSTLEITWKDAVPLFAIIFTAATRYSGQFAVAHEVMHKPGRFYRLLGTLHMIKMYYMHFAHSHLFIHHQLVSTPLDPASSHKGQTLYSFIYSSVVNSLRAVYYDEKKNGKTFFNNCAVWSVGGTLCYMTLIYLVFGLQPLIIHSIMAFGAICYLEGANYIEHYGL
jgi:alkane 1-monooxygenase